MMSVFSGLQVSKQIRKTNSHIPLVALTCIPFDEIKKGLSKSGINHYISKPAQDEELRMLLNEHFKTPA